MSKKRVKMCQKDVLVSVMTVKNVKISKNVQKIQKYCQKVKLSIWSWRSRTRPRRKGRSGEEEDEEGDK